MSTYAESDIGLGIPQMGDNVSHTTDIELGRHSPSPNMELGRPRNITIDISNSTMSKRVKQSWRDAKLAHISTRCAYLLLVIIGIAIILYEYIFIWLDDDVNKIIRTEKVQLDEGIDFPYFHIYSTGFLSDLSSSWLAIEDDVINMTDITEITVNDISEINYNEEFDDWSIIKKDDISWELIILPPYSFKIEIGEMIQIGLYSTSWGHSIAPDGNNESNPDGEYYYFDGNNESIPIPDYIDEDKSEQLAYHHANAPWFGYFWKARSPKELETIQYSTNNASFWDNFEKYEFTLCSTQNIIQMDSIKTVNKMYPNNPQQNMEEYEMTSKASMLDARLAYYVNYDEDHGYWYYYTQFYFFYNPSSGGVQTVITTDRLYGYMDMFSKTGGIFSPFKDGLLMFIAWLLFGAPFCCGCSGIAPKKALEDDEKQRIRTYLEEIGLLKPNDVEKIEEKEYERSQCC